SSGSCGRACSASGWPTWFSLTWRSRTRSHPMRNPVSSSGSPVGSARRKPRKRLRESVVSTDGRHVLSSPWGSLMKWGTRERVKVDRVACPWLIRKFIDPQAAFLFVPVEQVMAVAGREGAAPFDVTGVEFGHHGKECSFDALVKKCQLDRDPALVLLAK